MHGQWILGSSPNNVGLFKGWVLQSDTHTAGKIHLHMRKSPSKHAHKPTPANSNFPNPCEVQSHQGQSLPSLIHANALWLSSLFQILTQGEWTRVHKRTLSQGCVFNGLYAHTHAHTHRCSLTNAYKSECKLICRQGSTVLSSN